MDLALFLYQLEILMPNIILYEYRDLYKCNIYSIFESIKFKCQWVSWGSYYEKG